MSPPTIYIGVIAPCNTSDREYISLTSPLLDIYKIYIYNKLAINEAKRR
jgi:hypothetical protein